jgi:predicted Fe-Mo cluster-binding NifX family protein
MKVAISATGPDLSATVDPRFGRAQYFILVDPESLEFEAIPNPNINAMGGAGIQSAQLIGNRGVEAVVTGQVGPNAFQTLNAIGVQVYQAVGGTVAQAAEAYKAGRLTPIAAAGPSHAGMGFGRGMGRGGGGRFGAGGMGRGGQMAAGPGQAQFAGGMTPFAPAPQMSREQEVELLKGQAGMLGKQLEEINKRIEQLEKEKK